MRGGWLAFALIVLAGGCRGNHMLPVGPMDLATTPPDLAPALDLTVGDATFAQSFVTAVGADLYADGRRFRFVGANRYDLASFPPGASGFRCGNAYTDAQLDQLVGELATSSGATVLRAWAFQNFTLGGSDYSTIDRLIAVARKHGIKLILTLENEWKDCTQPDTASSDGRKSATWFASGYYSQPLGNDQLPYRDYVRQTVARYAGEPTIALWQLMNEAESTDGTALLAFAIDMAGVVKAADPNHLLSLGTIGSGQAGTGGAAYRQLHAVAGIDVVEAHDYMSETTALPAAIASDVQDANALGKPFFVGEAGIDAPPPMYIYTFAQRAAAMDAKIAAHWTAGTDGFLVWSFYDLKADNAQGWDFNGADPLAAVLARHAAEAP